MCSNHLGVGGRETSDQVWSETAVCDLSRHLWTEDWDGEVAAYYGEYILGALTSLSYGKLSPWDRSEATAALPPLERTRRWLESPRRSSRVSWPLWWRGLGFAWKRVLSVYSTAKGDRSETLYEDAAGRRWWPEMGGCGEWSRDAYKIHINYPFFFKIWRALPVFRQYRAHRVSVQRRWCRYSLSWWEELLRAPELRVGEFMLLY